LEDENFLSLETTADWIPVLDSRNSAPPVTNLEEMIALQSSITPNTL